jgi:hypothetical protein
MIKKNLLKAEEISRAFAGKSRSSQRCRHFSFIFDRSKLLSIGINSGKTHPLNLRYNYVNRENDSIGSFVGTHSEMSAVLKLGSKACKGLIMVNTRINRNDEMDYSFPCKGCMDMIKKLGFKSVFYTTKNEDFGIFELR